MEGGTVTNPVHTDWKPRDDEMVLTLQVGTWSKSSINFNKEYIQKLVSELTEWLKGK